jgi:hypothetical protein
MAEIEIQIEAFQTKVDMGFYRKAAWGAKQNSADAAKYSIIKKNIGLPENKGRLRKTTRSKPGRYICAQLWTGLQVNYDGEMLGCCKVKNSWGAGNVFVSGLLPVINGEKVKLAREMVLGRRKEREDIICTHCNRFKWMKKHSDWLTMREVMLLRFFGRARRSYIACGPQHYAKLRNAVMRLIS